MCLIVILTKSVGKMLIKMPLHVSFFYFVLICTTTSCMYERVKRYGSIIIRHDPDPFRVTELIRRILVTEGNRKIIVN